MFTLIIDATTQALIGAVIAVIVPITVAILGATWLETKRQNAVNETKKKTLRDALYVEIYFMMIWVLAFLSTATENNSTVSQTMFMLKDVFGRDDVYRSTRADPTLFYQLPDAVGLETFYRGMLPTLSELRAMPNLQPHFSEDGIMNRREDVANWMVFDCASCAATLSCAMKHPAHPENSIMAANTSGAAFLRRMLDTVVNPPTRQPNHKAARLPSQLKRLRRRG